MSDMTRAEEGEETNKEKEKAKVSRLYKKCSNDGELTIFLPRRELKMEGETGKVGLLEGVVLVSENLTTNPLIKIVIQVSLELRYGREDEELMGLQFSNEMVVVSQQLYPLQENQDADIIGPEDLRDRFGWMAIPFKLDLGSCLPPTIRLKPTRAYTGSPIGTTYTVSVFPTENVEERVLPNKSSMINMVIWVTESFPKIVDVRPIIVLRKVNRLFNGEIKLQAVLNKNIYSNGEPIEVNVILEMRPPRKIKYVGVSAVQAVDVAMFSSGFFKNEVGHEEEVGLGRTATFCKRFTISPEYRPGRHWVAIKDWGNIIPKDLDGQQLAASVIVKERSLFVIKVMYFVQVRVKLGNMRKDLEIKLPFLLAPGSTSSWN